MPDLSLEALLAMLHRRTAVELARGTGHGHMGLQKGANALNLTSKRVRTMREIECFGGWARKLTVEFINDFITDLRKDIDAAVHVVQAGENDVASSAGPLALEAAVVKSEEIDTHDGATDAEMPDARPEGTGFTAQEIPTARELSVLSSVSASPGPPDVTPCPLVEIGKLQAAEKLEELLNKLERTTEGYLAMKENEDTHRAVVAVPKPTPVSISVPRKETPSQRKERIRVQARAMEEAVWEAAKLRHES